MELEKTRINRVRRVAARRRLSLVRKRRYDRTAADYGKYQLLELDTNKVLIGERPYPFCATLDEVERYLAQHARAQLKRK